MAQWGVCNLAHLLRDEQDTNLVGLYICIYIAMEKELIKTTDKTNNLVHVWKKATSCGQTVGGLLWVAVSHLPIIMPLIPIIVLLTPST